MDALYNVIRHQITRKCSGKTKADRYADDRPADRLHGKTAVIKGFVSGKTGKSFEAAVALDAEFKTVFKFEDKKSNGGGGRKPK